MKQARFKNKLGKYNSETDSIIFSVKEVRKILGKEMSDKLSDEDLARIIDNKKESNSDSDSHMVISERGRSPRLAIRLRRANSLRVQTFPKFIK